MYSYKCQATALNDQMQYSLPTPFIDAPLLEVDPDSQVHCAIRSMSVSCFFLLATPIRGEGMVVH